MSVFMQSYEKTDKKPLAEVEKKSSTAMTWDDGGVMGDRGEWDAWSYFCMMRARVRLSSRSLMD